MVGYKRKGHFFSKTWLDISARGKFGPGSWLDISARGILETLKIAWLGIGARQKFARIVVGYKIFELIYIHEREGLRERY